MNELQKADYDVLKYFDAFCRKEGIEYFLFAGTLLGAVRHGGFIPWDDDIDIAMKRSEFEKFETLFMKSDYQKDGYTYQSRKVHFYQVHDGAKVRSNALNITERMPSTQKGNFGPWLDIFPYDNIPDDPVERKELFKRLTFYNKWLKKFLMIQIEPTDKGVRRLVKGLVQWFNETFYLINPFIPYLLKKRLEWTTKYNEQATTHAADSTFLYYRTYEAYEASFMSHEEMSDLVDMKFENSMFRAQRDYDTILTRYYGDYMTIPDEADRKVHKIEEV